jgi:hypothetical protein
MGVNACDRPGCKNILCYRIITTSKGEYYICSECQSELEETVKHWPKELTKGAFFRRLDEFMSTPAEGESIDPVRYLDKMLSEGKNSD